jgi:hypothetical protein
MPNFVIFWVGFGLRKLGFGKFGRDFATYPLFFGVRSRKGKGKKMRKGKKKELED